MRSCMFMFMYMYVCMWLKEERERDFLHKLKVENSK